MLLIEVKSLSKYFGAVRALHRIEMRLSNAECVAISGPNGSGKSTLLRCLAGIYRPDTGQVLANGIPVSQLAKRNRKRRQQPLVGYVGQELMLYRSLTIDENLRLHAGLLRFGKSDEAFERCVERLGLNTSLKKQLSECSFGTARRVAIARALIFQPQILLLDEPFYGLDSAGQLCLEKILQEYKEQRFSVVLVSHNRKEICCHAEREILLSRGRITSEMMPPAREIDAEATNASVC